MFNWLGRFRKKENVVPLTGAPAIRRQKAYSARSGYVYQYFYLGMRAIESGGESGTEYVFDVSADRTSSFTVSVFLAYSGVKAWNEAHGRELSAQECYAVAKMSLFEALDERPNPTAMREPVRVRGADVDAIADALDF